MIRKFATLIIIVSLSLSFYSTTLVKVSHSDEASISVLDVCSQKSQAGFMATPMMPEPVFAFDHQIPFESLSTEYDFSISHVYLAVMERPPSA